MTEAVTSAPVHGHPVEAPPAGAGGGFGSLGSIVHLLVLTWAAAIASYPLNDNSFFTHLATGRIILDDLRVPSSDPYTFTAPGEPWTVQSWLASVAYAGSERLAGDVGLRLLVLSVFLGAMTLVWQLTAPARSITTRLLIMALGLFVVSDLWSERPYMIGVAGLCVVWLALEGRVRPWVLVPVLWVWTNAHGSFPLAVLLCAAVVVGGILDRRREGQPGRVPDAERRTLGAVLLGIGAGAIGPLGPQVWIFPLTALTKRGVFAEVIEWRAPTYRSVAEQAFLVLVVVAVLLLARGRSGWRLAFPAVGFAAMGLTAQRNVVMAAVVLVAVIAAGAPEVGTLRAADRPKLGRAIASVLAALLVLTAGLCLVTPVDGFGGYPVRAIAHLGSTDVDGPVATEMPAGNLLEVLDGPGRAVFIDDRVDMFPEDVFDDFLTLRRGGPGWDEVLDRHDVAAVIWARSEPLVALLAGSPDWAVVYADTGWVVARRRAS